MVGCDCGFQNMNSLQFIYYKSNTAEKLMMIFLGVQLQKFVSMKIGAYQLRDPITKQFSEWKPIVKTVPQSVAESFAERVATLLVDCYNDYEKSKDFDCNAEKNSLENYIELENIGSNN